MAQLILHGNLGNLMSGFCRPEATLDNTWEEGISFEELPPLGWPMKMPVGHDLDY